MSLDHASTAIGVDGTGYALYLAQKDRKRLKRIDWRWAMPLLLTVCLVAATTAQVALAIVAIRALSRFNRVTDELERGARDFSDLALQTKALARELQGLVASLRGVVSPVRATAEAFGQAAQRAASLGSAVLQEMEGSVRTTTGLLRGVQLGAGYFLNRLVHSGRRARNGGNSYGRTSAVE